MGFLQLKPERQQIFSTLWTLICITGTGTFYTVPVDSNFSTRRSIVDLLGRLLRPLIGRRALNVEVTDAEFR